MEKALSQDAPHWWKCEQIMMMKI